MLLVVAGLLLRSLGASQRADVGFDPRGLAAVAFDTDMMRYEPERGAASSGGTALARVAGDARRDRGGHRSRRRLPFTFNFSQHEMKIDNRTYVEGQRGEIDRERRRLTRLPGHARRAAARGARRRRRRRRRRARRRDRQRDDGAALLAQRVGDRPHRAGRRAPAATFRVVGVDADHKRHGVLERRRRSSTSPRRSGRAATTSCWPAPAATPRRCVAAMRRELLAHGARPGHHGREHHGRAHGGGADAGAGRRDAGDRLRRPRHAAGGDRPLRGDRLLGGPPHQGDRPADGAGRRARRRDGDGHAPGLHARRRGRWSPAALLAAGVAVLLRGAALRRDAVRPVGVGGGHRAPWSPPGALANAVPARRAMRVEPLTALRTD